MLAKETLISGQKKIFYMKGKKYLVKGNVFLMKVIIYQENK